VSCYRKIFRTNAKYLLRTLRVKIKRIFYDSKNKSKITCGSCWEKAIRLICMLLLHVEDKRYAIASMLYALRTTLSLLTRLQLMLKK